MSTADGSNNNSNMQNIRQRMHLRRRWGTLKKSLEGVSWFFVGTVFIFSLGVIFFILGCIFLAPGHSDQTVGVIFLVIGLVGTLLGISTFLIRCFCPRSRVTRSARSQVHRHRGPRIPSSNHARSGDERRNSNSQRIWTTMPPLSASTPINENSFNRSISIEQSVSNAPPPTYDEAIGRSSISLADTHPPPYNIP